MTQLDTPGLDYFCTLEVDLSPPVATGATALGTRRIIPITGGRVHGPSISGRILGIGADWQTVLNAETAELDARYAFEIDGGAVIEIHNFGFRHATAEVAARLAAGDEVPPASYYMRTAARLTTGHPDYAWINRTMFVGTGARLAKAVQIDLYSVQ